ncbi:MAG: hypothetical protein PHW31_04150 [Candidatus Pacebacteria bacterium]|nr:hypothetical protein [Candidatus Paceibacterota bacterium]
MVIEIFVMTELSETQIKKNNEIIFLKDLPVGLKGKLTPALKMLNASQIVVNTGEVNKSILVLVGQNKMLSEINGEAGEKAKEALELLVWYYGQHFYSFSPGLIGGDIHCSHCGYTQSPGRGSGYCENPCCPSHEFWKKIIGASYKLPKKLKMSIHILPEMSPEQKKEFKKNLAEIKKQLEQKGQKVPERWLEM